MRKINGIELTVVCDERDRKQKSVIYACTHIGGVDIETAFEVIKNPCWLFLGDPREVYRNFDGLMLSANGVICVDSKDKEDRRIGKETAIGLLRQGGSLMIFPEGAWNISENEPVMGLFSGTAEMAIRSGARIVPIALECYGKHMYVAVGKNIEVSRYYLEDKHILTRNLRDTLTTLKWRIYEKVGVSKRDEIPKGYSEEFIRGIINDNKETSYTKQDVLDTMFVDRTVTTYEEAFGFMDRLTPNINNAFLFNKR